MRQPAETSSAELRTSVVTIRIELERLDAGAGQVGIDGDREADAGRNEMAQEAGQLVDRSADVGGGRAGAGDRALEQAAVQLLRPPRRDCDRVGESGLAARRQRPSQLGCGAEDDVEQVVDVVDDAADELPERTDPRRARAAVFCL